VHPVGIGRHDMLQDSPTGTELLEDETGSGGRETPDCHPVGQRGTTELPTFSILIIASRGGREN